MFSPSICETPGPDSVVGVLHLVGNVAQQTMANGCYVILGRVCVADLDRLACRKATVRTYCYCATAVFHASDAMSGCLFKRSPVLNANQLVFLTLSIWMTVYRDYTSFLGLHNRSQWW